MRALVVFELVPENTYFVPVDEPTEEELQVIQAAAGKFINSDDDVEAVEQISEWMEGKWKENKTEAPLLEGPFELVVLCGFIL